jgi:uncharacterized protein YqhQ
MPTYGGQAIIEGVMMRGAQVCAMAVRTPDQGIVIETKQLHQVYQSRLLRIPFLRGLILLWDALVLGSRALAFSANMQVVDEQEKIEGGSLVITMMTSLLIGITLFFLMPTWLAEQLTILIATPNWMINIFEGILRLSILIGYIWAIGRMPDIQRVYGYHGAEHKTINAFEAGAELRVEQVARFPREHPRCGTAFLLTVVLFSIILFTALGPMPILQRLLTRILFIPFLAAISYEYIRLTAKWTHHPILRVLIWPNLMLQHLTTREPESGMLEVAIASFNAMRSEETSM